MGTAPISANNKQNKQRPRCTNGPNCPYLLKGHCKFLHTPQELMSLYKQDYHRIPPSRTVPVPPSRNLNVTLPVLPPKAPSKACKICEVAYDSDVRFPMVLVNCGHTFCLFCCKQLKECPICRAKITKYLKNYQVFG